MPAGYVVAQLKVTNPENYKEYVAKVSEVVKKFDGEFKKRALWEHLPKKMMYQTFCVVIDYLLYYIDFILCSV